MVVTVQNQIDLVDLAAEILSQGKKFRFKALGSSMVPFISDGDVLTVVPMDQKSVQVGDIVLFRSVKNSLRAHRVIGIEARDVDVVFETRGDGALDTYEKIREGQILGIVTGRSRNGRWFHFHHPLHRLLVFIWIKLSPPIFALLHQGSLLKQSALKLFPTKKI